MKNLFLFATGALLALSACTSSPRGPGPARGYDRLHQQIRENPIGDPGKVAATDIAFSRAARDNGQWTAFAEYAAPGAVLHGAGGPIEAAPWLAAQQNPAESVRWGPKTVWSSCDGHVAVSFGRFIEPSGMVGSYVTVWEWQKEGRYRWVYDMGAADNPQPAPVPEVEENIDTIIVSGLASIEGRIADCLRGGTPPALPAVLVPANSRHESKSSPDGTLRWRWEHSGDGTRRFVADWLRNGTWQEALEFTAPPQGG